MLSVETLCETLMKSRNLYSVSFTIFILWYFAFAFVFYIRTYIYKHLTNQREKNMITDKILLCDWI